MRLLARSTWQSRKDNFLFIIVLIRDVLCRSPISDAKGGCLSEKRATISRVSGVCDSRDHERCGAEKCEFGPHAERAPPRARHDEGFSAAC
jgi:hypothetical protein